MLSRALVGDMQFYQTSLDSYPAPVPSEYEHEIGDISCGHLSKPGIYLESWVSSPFGDSVKHVAISKPF
jgi:hypothetical protein